MLRQQRCCGMQVPPIKFSPGCLAASTTPWAGPPWLAPPPPPESPREGKWSSAFPSPSACGVEGSRWVRAEGAGGGDVDGAGCQECAYKLLQVCRHLNHAGPNGVGVIDASCVHVLQPRIQPQYHRKYSPGRPSPIIPLKSTITGPTARQKAPFPSIKAPTPSRTCR
ncbi:hypothetical protein F751_1521 [Auxenochlorella protothecoides]|uniref:Uncharacterized protein n=1 Tax=Auxenochlorella protothecoides TaxID=3075 RepID=A0A087SFM5_AUXPR|nr:hypothetical protein F751_1521 [Auxenochlorella protothecoides]KFM24529.1 hypothetical protein F751_1521 [Auxenochlorella protothecoides]